MSEAAPSIRTATEAGIAADHAALPPALALVAATINRTEHNGIRPSLAPIACWRANDMRFEFESSFVRPEITKELGALKSLIDSLTLPDAQGRPQHKPAVTVFGHADPTGNDDFNKLLSGRRAQAIYGMLVRNVALWEDLYSRPLGSDKWEPKATHAMQSTLGRPLSDRPSTTERQELFKAYMDRVCTVLDANDQPVQFKLEPADFLAAGADPGGKGDFQGCGEFNPVFLQSENDIARFERLSTSSSEKAAAKTARDAANEPDRRVLIFLFRAGIRINPQAWPCPRVKEGVAGCKARFWSDGEQRRGKRLADKPRKFGETRDTFACRFYHRLAITSPCEGGAPLWVIRLLEDGPEPIDQRRPLANLPFSVTGVGGGLGEIRGTTDSRGVLRIIIKDNPAVMKVTVAGQEITVFAGSLKGVQEGAEGVVQRLRNLGFGVLDQRRDTTNQLIAGLAQFQRLHSLPVLEQPNADFRKKLQEFHGS